MYFEHEVVYSPMGKASSNFLSSTFRIDYLCGNAISFMVWDYFALGKEEIQVLSRMVYESRSEKINEKKRN